MPGWPPRGCHCPTDCPSPRPCPGHRSPGKNPESWDCCPAHPSRLRLARAGVSLLEETSTEGWTLGGLRLAPRPSPQEPWIGRPREEPVGWVLGCGHGSCLGASSRKHHPRGNGAEQSTPSLRARVGGPHRTCLPRKHRCQMPGGREAMQCQGSGDSAQHSSAQVPASADILLPSQANGTLLLGEAEVEAEGTGSRRSLPYHGAPLEHTWHGAWPLRRAPLLPLGPDGLQSCSKALGEHTRAGDGSCPSSKLLCLSSQDPGQTPPLVGP